MGGVGAGSLLRKPRRELGGGWAGAGRGLESPPTLALRAEGLDPAPAQLCPSLRGVAETGAQLGQPGVRPEATTL